MQIAYYYEFDYASGVNPLSNARQVIEYINQWKKNPENGCLSLFETNDKTLILYDTRSDAANSAVKLGEFERAVYQFCDQVRSIGNIVKFLTDAFPDLNFSEINVKQFLDWATENRLMVSEGENYLSLAIRPQPLVRNAEKPENGTQNKKQKPLSSYLPTELPIFTAHSKPRQMAV